MFKLIPWILVLALLFANPGARRLTANLIRDGAELLDPQYNETNSIGETLRRWKKSVDNLF